ncbi:phosphotransferase enzyme family protein, partial [Paenibacillus solisilvae]
TLEDLSFNADQKETEILEYVLRTAENIVSVIPDRDYQHLEKLVIHGDYHPGNLKFLNNSVCGLFDFDWISIQPRIRDVVDGIIYFSAIRSEGIDGSDIFSLTQPCSFDNDRSKLFVDAYQSNCHRPLDTDEIAIIPYLMKARLVHSRVEALTKIPVSRRVEMLTKGISEPLLWLDNHYDEFVKRLQQ